MKNTYHFVLSAGRALQDDGRWWSDWPGRHRAPFLRGKAPMEALVEHAISTMWSRYEEPLTLEGIAAEVFVSPFHFCRVFSRVTGMTPGRYLTAIRLFEAKRLLVTTRHTVSDIVCRVGYSSVGTFTTRFVRRTGMTPTQYRDPPISDLAVSISPGSCQLPAATEHSSHAAPRVGPGERVVHTRVALPPGPAARTVLVGLFDEPVPHRSPVAYRLLGADSASVDVTLEGVPDGRWTVLAAAVDDAGARPAVVGAANLDIVGPADPTPPLVVVTPGTLRPTTPPVAITLGDPRTGSWALEARHPETAGRHLRAVA